MSPTKNTKRVQFGPLVKAASFVPENDQVFEIESCTEYSQQELQDYYHTTEQLNRISLRRSAAAKQWEQDKSKLPSNFCIRGLEHCTLKLGDEIQSNIERCIDAVMDEQQEQWNANQDNFDRISVVSQMASKGSVEQALARALEDEAIAQRIYERKEKATKTSSKTQSSSRIKTLLKPVLRIRR